MRWPLDSTATSSRWPSWRSTQISTEGAAGPVTGTVHSIGPIADTSSGVATFPVVVNVTGTPAGLYAGASATISIIYHQVRNGLVVPSAAIRYSGPHTVVTVLSGGPRVTRDVTLGQEPTGNLDSASTADILALLGELHAAGRTIVVITHEVMLVSVTERIREIGLRKALGATPRVIRRQFLVEASLLGLAGGVLGAAAGLAGAVVLPRLIPDTITISPAAVAGSIAVAVVIGLVFGVYPAGQQVVLAVLGKPLPTSNGNQGPVIGAGLTPAGNGVVVGPP